MPALFTKQNKKSKKIDFDPPENKFLDSIH